MEMPSLFPSPTLSVSELTRLIRTLLESEPALSEIWVAGEISNFTRAASGHMYFTLKDSGAALKCVIWRNAARTLRVALQDGMAIEAFGSIGVYEQGGNYQFYITAVRPAGEGWLYQQFLRLKARLEAEGLFAEERKRPIPPFPRRIGVVTSPTGAALQDILNTLQRRYPLVEVILAPSAVQGEEAPLELVRALEALNRIPDLDVILLARGGGSIEDLWAFNDESVVRAVAASRVPVITGVGHETDFTLVDFAADLRAPTPTGAATLATPDRTDLLIQMERMLQRLNRLAVQRLKQESDRLRQIDLRLRRVSPVRRVEDNRQRLDTALLRLQNAASRQIALRQAHLQALTAHLSALNPLAVLDRGFALIESPQGNILTRARQARPGDAIHIHLADGKLAATVEKVLLNPAEGEK
jgi:exodeoxyribonuclease VII large subunit